MTDAKDGTIPMAQAVVSAPLAAHIRVLSDGHAGAFRLRDGTCRVGSGSDCDLVVKHRTVSRTHVELELVAEGVRVTDLDSRNGTFYLGQRVKQITVALGAHLRLGEAELALEPDTDALFDDLQYDSSEYRGMLGTSLSMRRLFAIMRRLEGSLASVLIEGESGVGKELIARAIHEGSARRDGPFVAINCGAISRELIGSELFGHIKGAFSGAVDSRVGAFRSADGGTLFLDELGELPLDLQPNLLRALEAGEVRPVGSDQVTHVSVRLVTATNQDLEQNVREGRFREDLFYRLAVVRAFVPPLRERRDDIEPLVRRFAEQSGIGELPTAVVERLKSGEWPGNVRELRNAIEAYAAVRVLPQSRAPRGISGPAGMDASLDDYVDLGRPYLELRDELVAKFSQRYIERAMEKTGNNKTAAAEIAGLDRKHFRTLLERFTTD